MPTDDCLLNQACVTLYLQVKAIRQRYSGLDIEVDGGVSLETIEEAAKVSNSTLLELLGVPSGCFRMICLFLHMRTPTLASGRCQYDCVGQCSGKKP